MCGLCSGRRRIGEWQTILDRRATDPTVVAVLIGAECFLFSTLWYGLAVVNGFPPFVPVTTIPGLVALFTLTVGNGAGTAWVVWRVASPSGAWRYRYGAGLGLAIGLLSHAALGIVLVGFALRMYGVEEFSAAGFSFTLLLYALFSILFTAGIPILLSLGTGIGLTYCRRQVADSH